MDMHKHSLPCCLSPRRRQRGVAAIELMIVTPLILFLILAVAEFGNAIRQYNTLTQTVRDAARYIAEEAGAGSSVVILNAQKIAATANLAAYGSVSGTNEVLPGLTPAAITVQLVNGIDVSVAAAYQYRPIFLPGVPNLLGQGAAGGAFTMNCQVIMRVL